MVNVCGHQAIDQTASLPVDLVLLGGWIHQHHQLTVGEIAHPRHAGDHPVLGVERRDTRTLDVQLQLDQRLVVDAGARFADAGDLRERQYTGLLEGLGLGGRLGAEVGQGQRDENVERR